jgi:hypothetical protein
MSYYLKHCTYYSDTWGVTFCIPEGITHERHLEVQGQGEVGTKICWSLLDSRSQKRCGLSTLATTTAIRCTRHVSCISAQEVLMSYRKADTYGTNESRRRSIILREANQNFRYDRMGDSQ